MAEIDRKKGTFRPLLFLARTRVFGDLRIDDERSTP